jgi:SOS-response transcriptional repressor LexA
MLSYFNMHTIQELLLGLSKRTNLAELSLREMAARIGLEGEAPQKIKHHLQQLERRGFLTIDRERKLMARTVTAPGWAKGLLESTAKVFSIPIVGTANCGPATLFAEQNVQGFLRVSSKLVGRSQPAGLYAIKTDGSSMNRAEINGRIIEDGDLVIVDGRKKSPDNGDIVVAIVDQKATIKRFVDDRANGQVVLRADSSFDYEPIHLHPEDDFSISGQVIAVIKKPSP